MKSLISCCLIASMGIIAPLASQAAKRKVADVRCTAGRHEIGGDTPDIRMEKDCRPFAKHGGKDAARVCKLTATLPNNTKLDVMATYSGLEILHTSVRYKDETTGTDGGSLSIIDKDALAKYTVSCVRQRPSVGAEKLVTAK